MKRYLLTLFIFFLIALTGIYVIAPAKAQENSINGNQENELFDFIGTRKDGELANSSIASVREQAIDINFSALFSGNSTEILIPLFDGKIYKAVKAKKDGVEWCGFNDYSWRGQIDGKPEWSAIFSVKDRALSGIIFSPAGVYEIIPQKDFQHILIELDQNRFPECGVKSTSTLNKINPELDHSSIFSPQNTREFKAVPEDTGTQIDVMVVYTPAVRTSLGGTSQTQSRIQLSVDSANLAYSNSQINPRLRLVHTQEVSYTETGSLSSDLDWVDGNSTVRSARDTSKADLVSLIVNNGDACGLAWLMNPVSYDFNSSGFSVVLNSCAVGNLSFAHELGHNQGCGHNPEDAFPGTYAYPYAFGHYSTSGNFRTIMSYENPCPGCPRVVYFSNPSVTYNGIPMGTNTRDNHRVINNTAYTVANFKDTSGCSIRAGENSSNNELTAFQYAYVTGGSFLLGCPNALVRTDGFTSFAGTVSHYQTTTGGDLEYHTNGQRAGQAFAILTPFLNKWASFGYNSNNPMGYPIGFTSLPANSCYGTQNRYQSFEGGSLNQHLSGSRNGQIFEVHGAIHRKWELTGFAVCPLGMPTSDETTAQPSGATGSTGKLNQFEGGQIYWKTNAAAAYEVHGAIYNSYVGLGGSASWLGFPTSDEYLSNGRARNDFEAGYITTLDGVNYQAFPYTGCPSSASPNPSTGQVGTTVTITGNNFTGVNSVRFTNNVSAQFTVNNSTQITATVPNGAVTGPITIGKTGCANLQTGTFTVGTPTIQFSSAAFSVNENSGTATITVNRSSGSGTASVNYATSNGTATAGQDYTGVSNTLSFAAGETSRTFTVPITNDSVYEGNETVNLTLSSPSGATLGTPSSAVLTIVDNETQPTLSINDVSLNEGNSGTTSFNFNVVLSSPSSQTVTVNYATANGTATAGSDYQAVSNTLTFNPNETSKSISVFVNGDTQVESNETFLVNLSNAQNAGISDSQGSGTILNDDSAANPGILRFSSATYSVNENGGTASITVTRTNGSDGTVSVNYSTANGTASAGSDYNSASDTLTFAQGVTSRTFNVTILDDQSAEGNETVNLSLSNPSGGATLGSPATAVLTIIDNDPACTYTINPPSASFTANGGGSSFNVIAPNGCSWTATVSSSPLSEIIESYDPQVSLFDTISQPNSPAATFPPNTGTLGAIPDSPSATAQVPGTPRDVTFTVSGISGNVSNVELGWGGTHSFVGDLKATLIAPNGASHTLFGYTGATTATSFGDESDIGGPYIFKDNAVSPPLGGWWQNATAMGPTTPLTSGDYRTTNSGGAGAANPMPATSMNAAFAGVSNPNGTWTLRITDGAAQDTGSITAASLTIAGTGSQTNWLTVTSGNGNGNGTVGYSVAQNSGAFRSGQITVWANGQPQAVHTVSQSGATSRRAPFDYDGDGKTDVSVYRPSNGQWWIVRSSNLEAMAAQFGTSADLITPGDYTGDGKADIAHFRPSTGEWFILRSENGTYFSFQFGLTGDFPAPADYDGDGLTDTATFRPSTATWYIFLSGSATYGIVTFGLNGDRPVPADFDGDGKADIAVWRASNGTWWIVNSSNLNQRGYGFGTGTDKPVVGDYTGDGKADIAVWRNDTREWLFLRSEDGSYYSYPSGLPGDIPAPGDYDGDGRFDSAVFRPTTRTWYVDGSSAGSMIMMFGLNGDKPTPSAYVP